MHGVEPFTPEERKALAPYFTNLDGPVFALVNLPEVVKGALFARYSRSAKSLRRLFLDEFLEQVGEAPRAPSIGTTRADQLYERVFSEYGDDSVAQLGGVHLACEGASNILTKVLEWGRLMAYLEQSTRYVPYTDRPDGRWKYHVPAELDGHPLRARYVETLDRAFETYARWIEPMREFWSARFPRPAGESDAAWRMTIRAKALDSLRGLLPAATRSNVGIYGTGQAYEALLLRMRAQPLREVQDYAELMLAELRKVIPAFLKRLDRPERGGAWARYLAETRRAMEEAARRVLAAVEPEPRAEVTLTDWDPEGEVKVVAAALYAVSDLPDDQLLAIARKLSPEERETVLGAYVGRRENRRHKPGRAFERTAYRFDVLGDYGAFRDLQRHRLLTLEWQTLSPRHGYAVGEEIGEAGALDEWRRVMDESAALHDALAGAGLGAAAPYAVAMAYRVRFYMEMNAREALHVIELRTPPQGHPAYRRICQEMHRLIAEQAGHRALAAAMSHVDHSGGESGRLFAERAAERRRAQGS
ncbi:MAG TPA: FAD-dependent thymidylate synthase [Methylomirabilota bacterium]|nr:FAD-dependent thymidylate synthase [Methylomirabilota bacterium]